MQTYLQTRSYDDIQTYATIARRPLADMQTYAGPLHGPKLEKTTNDIIKITQVPKPHER